MKQIVTFMLAIALLATTAVSCAEAAPDQTPTSRVLVAYFSRAGENYNVGVVEKGNTQLVAEAIAVQTGADLFAIAPVTPYPESYEATKTIATAEAESDARPEMLETLENADDYDVIFVGYPIWWGGMPMMMYTFLESADFSGKTLIPFNTHEGSGQGGTVEQIRALCPNATVLDGFAVRGSVAQNDADTMLAAVEEYLATVELP